MEKGFKPAEGADGWQLSNAPIISMAVLKASLDLFEQAGIGNLRAKSLALTGYLEFLIGKINSTHTKVNILTPADPEQRGCQLSLSIPAKGKEVFNYLIDSGIIADWREPNVIRVAPVPLYNTFTEVFQFSSLLQRALNV